MSPRPVVLVTGRARRLGREIALELARDGWRRGGALPPLEAERAGHGGRRARARGAAAACFGADLADEAAAARCCPQRCRALRRRRRGGQQRLAVRTRQRGELQPTRRWNATGAANVGAGGPAGAGAARPSARPQAPRSRGCVGQPARPEAVEPEPGSSSPTRCPRPRWKPPTPMLAQALAPPVRVCGVAPGVTLPSGPMDAEQFAPRPPADAAAALLDRRRRGADGALPARVAGDHRHHAAGRRRPAPGRPSRAT